VVADVLRYRKVADFVLAGHWNPYALRGLYPYPPLWVWVEAGAGWLAAHSGLSFSILVKLPLVMADVAAVALLWSWGRERGLGAGPAWLYAVHPVSLLVTGFHGQFDTLMLLAVLLAFHAHEQGRQDASAFALAVAIAVKSFPVLLLPFLAARSGGARQAARFTVLCLLPVGVILLPFVLADARGVARELAGYGGVADFGWIGLWRGANWLQSGSLARSEAWHWPISIALAKGMFLMLWAGLAVAFARGRLRWSLLDAALAVFLAFQVFYGAVSAQYLLWVVPLALLIPERTGLWYGVAASIALLGFYVFLQPAIVWPHAIPPAVTQLSGVVWVAGVAASLGVASAWLVALVRRGFSAALVWKRRAASANL
jgi:hypothetical protein